MQTALDAFHADLSKVFAELEVKTSEEFANVLSELGVETQTVGEKVKGVGERLDVACLQLQQMQNQMKAKALSVPKLQVSPSLPSGSNLSASPVDALSACMGGDDLGLALGGLGDVTNADVSALTSLRIDLRRDPHNDISLNFPNHGANDSMLT